ncbi:uncharacterized protein LOC108111545 isoform X3 [Drosophila eugracilis]|uniref:uncharacterized protein LOC108111545 isoform X3 n=1 Tax=Drosophila eugracilis TaxID=29029 RepID=UPI001BDAA267|nr:uncharacterized protein LOC108111545 isoform X3 [Drosophila eugracilis]
MEHVDIAGYTHNTAPNWKSISKLEQQDAVFLSISRHILDPIIEETSEDEKHSPVCWRDCQMHRSPIWSSTELETGSMIRIDVMDGDVVSERDFVCPPKRPKRGQDLDSGQSFEDSIQLRRSLIPDPEIDNSSEHFLTLDACVRESYESQGQWSSISCRRGGTFDDFYSENDSHHSLSRSSSLVQFESLERQFTLQEQHHSMGILSNSSPLLICELNPGTGINDTTTESRKGSSSSLSIMKRYESSDCSRLHQTYHELKKINFEKQQQPRELSSKILYQVELNSDLETSSSSSSSSNSSVHSFISSCLISKDSYERRTIKPDSTRRLPPNSAENLSVDSGYCEVKTQQHEKSKSLPDNFDKLFEEEEELLLMEDGAEHSRYFNGGHDLCQPKIDKTVDTPVAPSSHSPSSINSYQERASSQSLPSPTESASTSFTVSLIELLNSLPGTGETYGPAPEALSCALASKKKKISHYSRRSHSASSIDSCNGIHATQSLNKLQYIGRCRCYHYNHSSQWNCDSNKARSFAEGLNLKQVDIQDSLSQDCRSLTRIQGSCIWNECARKDLGVASSAYLNVSYQDLTLLDYTDNLLTAKQLRKNDKRSEVDEMADRRSVVGGDYKSVICTGNFLLDEISKIYDKNVSILTDKPIMGDQLLQEDCISNAAEKLEQVHHVQLNIKPAPPQKKNQQQPLSIKNCVKSFDQDPTFLRTSYSYFLKQCHFGATSQTKGIPCPEVSQRSLYKRRLQSQALTAKQRSLVRSTPNLSDSLDGRKEPEEDIYVSSAYTSMQNLPQESMQTKPLGILLTSGSRHSFGKEVSFCPVVSKYCWQEQSSEDPPEDQGNSDEYQQGSSSDGLIDNADVKLKYNTKKNENIAEIFNLEETHRLRNSSSLHEYTTPCTNPLSTYENCGLDESGIENNAKIDRQNQKSDARTTLELKTALKITVNHEPTVVNSPYEAKYFSVVNDTPIEANLRPLSLPVLSEPPTNRAYHILLSSQNLLQRYEPEVPQTLKKPLARKPTIFVPTICPIDKKSASRGFLYKFATGLRSSLHRKMKQKQDKHLNHLPDSKQSQKNKALPWIEKESGQSIGNGRSSDVAKQQTEQLSKTLILHKVTGKPPLPNVTYRSGILAHASKEAAVGIANANNCHPTEASLSTDQLTADIHATTMWNTELTTQESSAQKTQMSNQHERNSHSSRPTMVTAFPVDVAPEEEVGRMGFIETNLDTHETVIRGKTRSLMDITCNPLRKPPMRCIEKRQNVNSTIYDVNEMGAVNINSSSGGCDVKISSISRPHKSMEFLLDKENQKNFLPPENELQKSHDNNPSALSEYQQRVQASLQRLNIPDWFRHYNKETGHESDDRNAVTGAFTGCYRPSSLTRERTQESGRWQALNSKTTSLSSLGSHRSNRSPLLMSPSAHSQHGGQILNSRRTVVGDTRWSTSHLNSTQTSLTFPQRVSFSRGAIINNSFTSVASSSGVLRNSYRQPYLGWRSIEKLSQRTPHERLANSLLTQRTTSSSTFPTNETGPLQSVTPEVQSSIKEVSSAIVHYVNDQEQTQNRSGSSSPNSRKCWVESSFVGSRPLDSPQTPVIDKNSPELLRQQDEHHQKIQPLHHSQLQKDASLLPVVAAVQPPLNGVGRVGGGGEWSLSNASLEDVLDSLLGLPNSSLSSQNSNYNQNNIRYAASTTTDDFIRYQMEIHSAVKKQRLRRHSEVSWSWRNESAKCH